MRRRVWRVGGEGTLGVGEVSEADEAAVRVGRGEVGRGALLLRARVRRRVRRGVRVRVRVRRQRVRVHGRQARAALHQAVEVERDAVAGRADLDFDLVVVAQRFVVVDL